MLISPILRVLVTAIPCLVTLSWFSNMPAVANTSTSEHTQLNYQKAPLLFPQYRLSAGNTQPPSIDILAAPIQSPSSSPLISLTPEEKRTFWDSPLVPTGMSLIAPGSGQLYQSNFLGADKDWFSFARGIGYLTIMGIAYWQLFSNASSNQTSSMAPLWTGILIGVNVLSPVDAYVTSQFKEGAYQEQLVKEKQRRIAWQKLLEQAEGLATYGSYEQAMALLQQIPPEAPQFAQVASLMSKWKRMEHELKARQQFDAAYEVAKSGDFATAVTLMRAVPSDALIAGHAKTKADEWQHILDERESKALFEQAQQIAKTKNFPKAVEALKRIKPGTSYYPKAQNFIKQWEPLIPKK